MPSASTPEAAQVVRDLGAQFEAMAADVNRAVWRRWAWFDAFSKAAGTRGLNYLNMAGNVQANKNAKNWARMLVALRDGAAELVGYQPDPKGPVQLACVRAGQLSAFPLVPIIVTAIAAGVLLVAHVIASASKLQSQAEQLDAQNRRAITDAIAKAKPDDRAALAAALKQANQAATRPPPTGWLDRLVTGLGKAASSSTPWLLLAAGWYFLSKRKGSRG